MMPKTYSTQESGTRGEEAGKQDSNDPNQAHLDSRSVQRLVARPYFFKAFLLSESTCVHRRSFASS